MRCKWVVNFLTHARHARAFPGNFDFLLSQPSQKGAFTVKIPCSLSGSWMEEFPNFWALVEHLLAMFSVCLTNFVPNRDVIIWIWLFYREFCEGCESKKLKIAVGARVCARVEPLSWLPRYAMNTVFFPPWFSRAFFGELSFRVTLYASVA